MYNHKYPSCERTYASFIIKGNSLCEKNISSTLGAEPSWVTKKGNSIRGTERVVKEDGWCFTTRDLIESRDVEFHLHQILGNLSKDMLEEIKNNNDITQTYIAIFWESKSGNGGPRLSAETSNMLGNLGIEVRFDIWF